MSMFKKASFGTRKTTRSLALLVIAIATGGIILGGCSDQPKPTIVPVLPLALPVVIKQNLDLNVFGTNKAIVVVKNEGEAGYVELYVERVRTDVSYERSESGVEKALRESLTRKSAPPPKRKETRKVIRSWKKTIRMESGQTQTVSIPLPGHSSWGTRWKGHKMSVGAVAVHKPKEKE